MIKGSKKHLPNYEFLEDANVMEPYKKELVYYFEGRIKEFSLPMIFMAQNFNGQFGGH